MSKEVRAVVLGLFVVIVAALALSFWRRPAAEFRRIRGFRVEVTEKDGSSRRHMSFTIPSGLIANIAKYAPMHDIRANLEDEWGSGDVTPRDILDAAEKSQPGSPGVLKKDDATVEVVADGEALEIDVKDTWDKHVHIRLPRVLIESLSDDSRLSTSEILRRLDELGPGDVVTIHDGDSEVKITAQARRSGIRID